MPKKLFFFCFCCFFQKIYSIFNLANFQPMHTLKWLIGHSFLNQLLLELSLYPLNILQVCYIHNEGMHEEVQC